MSLGTLYGVGVGPGALGLIPVAAVAALHRVHAIYLPRAEGSEGSVAAHCLDGLGLDGARLHELPFPITDDPGRRQDHYAAVAAQLAPALLAGHDVAYVTLGDSLTYSTYGYALAALRSRVPELRVHTFPGVTSFAAVAARFGFPLGVGKERVLLLPCPDDEHALEREIATHDVVVLLKIGRRLPMVLRALDAIGVLPFSVFARRIGLPGERLVRAPRPSLAEPGKDGGRVGYLSTMLVRKGPWPDERA